MSEPLVLTDKHEGVCRVTLNRPEALNALSTGLRRELTRTFQGLAEDPDTEVAILTGAGRAFTVGLDLKELGGEVTHSENPTETAASTDVAEAMLNFDRPIIGAINGFAITGGFEIALMCDFLIASTEAKFRRHTCSGRRGARLGSFSAPPEVDRDQPGQRTFTHR